jgi:MSHA pilin protein MshD
MSTRKASARRASLDTRRPVERRSRGLSLVEQIMFILIVGAAVAGVIGVIDVTTRSSADPMLRKQALAIAEAMMEEVRLQPFTYCDPDDPAAATASTGGCPVLAESMGPEPGETRYSSTLPFDNVNDYHGFDSNTAVPPGIRSIDGTAIAGLDGYRVTVSVAGQTLGGVGNDALGNPQSLLITVTVTGPGNTTVTLNSYRTRYAPNALP